MVVVYVWYCGEFDEKCQFFLVVSQMYMLCFGICFDVQFKVGVQVCNWVGGEEFEFVYEIEGQGLVFK